MNILANKTRSWASGAVLALLAVSLADPASAGFFESFGKGIDGTFKQVGRGANGALQGAGRGLNKVFVRPFSRPFGEERTGSTTSVYRDGTRSSQRVIETGAPNKGAFDGLGQYMAQFCARQGKVLTPLGEGKGSDCR